jgi:hypothetical protein
VHVLNAADLSETERRGGDKAFEPFDQQEATLS